MYPKQNIMFDEWIENGLFHGQFRYSNSRKRDCISIARKVIIRTGLALRLNNQWEERQLFAHVEQNIGKLRNHFDGEAVVNVEDPLL